MLVIAVRAGGSTSRSLLTGSCLAFLACAPSRIDPKVEDAIADAVGVEGAVTFRLEGDPVNRPAAAADLSLAAAVRLALENDPGIQRSLSRVRVALADAGQARLLANPVLSILFRFPTHGGKPEIEAGLSAGLTSLLQRGRRASAADHRLRAAAADAVTTALDVVLLVEETYAKAQVSEAQIPLLESRRDTLDRLLAFASARLAVGEGTQIDVDGLHAQRLLVELELEQNLLQRRELRLVLARIIGEPLGAALWRLEPWQALPPSDIAEPRWIETALARRPEISAVTWELSALGDDLALTGITAILDPSAGIAAEGTGDGWSLGPSAGAELPLFDSGQARRDRVRAEIVEKRHELTQVQRRVIEEVRLALENYRYAERALARVQAELLPLQERRRAQTERAFRSSEVDLTALLFAEQEAKAGHGNRVQLEHLLSVSRARLERAVGGPAAAKGI